MLTKTNVEMNVVGQVAINGKAHFIVKLEAAKYQQGVLYSHILVPVHNFSVPNGAEWAEVVIPTDEPVGNLSETSSNSDELPKNTENTEG